MNRLQFYLSLLKFSIINPNKGMNMLQSFNQGRADQQNKQKIHKYANIKYDTKEAISSFFPESDSQNTESKQNIVDPLIGIKHCPTLHY